MYNENRVIADTAKRLSQYMEANFEDWEIVFCSDGSTDGCDKTVEALALPNVRVVAYPDNHGKGYAVRTARRSPPPPRLETPCSHIGSPKAESPLPLKGVGCMPWT